MATLLAGICVLFHYEAMSRASRLLPRLRLVPRMRIVCLITVLLAAHVVEIWIFAVVYWFLVGFPQLGGLSGSLTGDAADYVYFSATAFTTMGFGDIVPLGPLRILVGSEALVGLGLITWSASLGFLEMQRDWAEFQSPE